MRVLTADYSYFDQMMKNFMNGKGWFSEACQCNHFGVHSTYFFYLVAPIHYFFSHPIFLNMFHGIMLTIGVFPFIGIAKNLKVKPIDRFIFAFIFLNYVQLAIILKYNFHPESLFIPVLLWMFYDLTRGKAPIVSSIVAFSIREDAGLYVAFIWLSSFLFHPKVNKKTSVAFIILSLATFILSFSYVIPKFRLASNELKAIPLMSYKYGQGLSEILKNVIKAPWLPAWDILSGSWWKFVGKFLFLPLMGPTFLVSVFPVLFVFCTSSFGYMNSFSLYYSATLVPFLLYGLLIGFSKIKLQPTRKFAALMVILIINNLVGSGYVRYANKSKYYGEYLNLIKPFKEKQLCLQSILMPVTPYSYNAWEFGNCHKKSFDTLVINKKLNLFPTASNADFEKHLKKVLGDKKYEISKKGDFLIYNIIK